MRNTAENNSQIYKNDLFRTNKLYEENEKKYSPLLEKIKLNEENKISFLKFHFEKFSKNLEEFNLCSFDLTNRLNNSFVEININDDLNNFDSKFNYRYKNNDRFPKEEFLNYDNYRKNLDKIVENNSSNMLIESFQNSKKNLK